MKISIHQTLSLALGPGLVRAVQHLLLTPRNGTGQSVIDWRIDMPGIEGAPSFTDGFGNIARLVTQTRPEAELLITVSGVVETTDYHGVVGRMAGEPPPALFRRATALTKPIGAITSKFRSAPRDGKARLGVLHALMDRVDEVLSGTEVPAQEQSQSQSQGQSQSQSQSQGTASAGEPTRSEKLPAADYAHAFIGAARALDIPARYVRGFVAEHEEISAAHAWAEAWDDGLGWIAFDPMLGYCPTERHVRVAVGFDAATAVAVRSHPTVGTPQTLVMQVEALQ